MNLEDRRQVVSDLRQAILAAGYAFAEEGNDDLFLLSEKMATIFDRAETKLYEAWKLGYSGIPPK